VDSFSKGAAGLCDEGKNIFTAQLFVLYAKYVKYAKLYAQCNKKMLNSYINLNILRAGVVRHLK